MSATFFTPECSWSFGPAGSPVVGATSGFSVMGSPNLGGETEMSSLDTGKTHSTPAVGSETDSCDPKCICNCLSSPGPVIPVTFSIVGASSSPVPGPGRAKVTPTGLPSVLYMSSVHFTATGSGTIKEELAGVIAGVITPIDTGVPTAPVTRAVV